VILAAADYSMLFQASSAGLKTALVADLARTPHPDGNAATCVGHACAMTEWRRLLLAFHRWQVDGGASGAHQREICPEALRTAETPAAAQTVRRLRPPKSEAPPTRPGRLPILG
jgi:hypothetical protein